MNRTSTVSHGADKTIAAAFSLVELLVAIGIIAILIGILFPVISSARRRARDIQCASNMRQICLALISYAGQNNGYFPPNSAQTGVFWYQKSIIGPYLASPKLVGRSGAIPPGADKSVGLAGGVFVCPNDRDDSVRSYSMNVYASGGVSSYTEKIINGKHPRGSLFKYGTGADSSKLMLLLESWPELPVKGTNPTVYVAQAVIGLAGTKPGVRFGAGMGLDWKTPVDGTPGRFPDRLSQIAFYRHEEIPRSIEDPRGRANFGFVDGHVEMLAQSELIRDDRYSSYLALWSPIDQSIEQPPSP